MSELISENAVISKPSNTKAIKHLSENDGLEINDQIIAKIIQQFKYRDINANFIRQVEATRRITYFFELDEHHLNDIIRVDDSTTIRMLEVALKTSGISILAPVPETSQIAVIVPKKTDEPVRLSRFVDEIKKQNYRLPFVLGEDYLGNPRVIDLAECHHQLIGGRTGSGKSNSLKAAITAIAMTCDVNNLRILMIDGKGIDMGVFNKLPHLLCPAFTERKFAIKALRELSKEMERRMFLLNQRNISDIWAYNKQLALEMEDNNQNPPEALPAILLVIDEVQVLINGKSEDAESLLRILTQQGRACGIIVVLSTQRPSVDIIQGSIKTNLPGRIAFSLPTNVDSRVILDQPGAELLRDKGDFLAIEAPFGEIMRLQAPLVTDEQIKEVCNSLICQKEDIYDTNNEPVSFSEPGDLHLNFLGGDENIVEAATTLKIFESVSLGSQDYKISPSKFAKVLVKYKDINEWITKKYNDRTWHIDLLYFPFLYGNVQKNSSLSKILYNLRTDRFIKKLIPLDTVGINRNIEDFNGELQVFESLRDTATKITPAKDIPIADSKSSDDRESYITSLIEKGFIGVTPKGYFIRKDFESIPRFSGKICLIDIPEVPSKQVNGLFRPIEVIVEQLRFQLWKIWQATLEKYTYIGLPVYRALSTQNDIMMYPACSPIWRLKIGHFYSDLEKFHFNIETHKDEKNGI